jgi:hypothetical protein
MGDHEAHRGPEEIERLQRESQELLAELKAKLNELDRARDDGNGLVTPEQRRRSFRLIKGGAVIVGAIAAAGAALRRPVIATAVGGTAAVGTAALMLVPIYEPIEPDRVGQRPDPVVSPAPVELEPSPARAVANVTDDEPEPESSPTRGAIASAPTPAPTSIPVPAPSPSATPKVTASVTVSPSPSPTELVQIEVYAEDNEACVDSELVGLELALCLDGVR